MDAFKRLAKLIVILTAMVAVLAGSVVVAAPQVEKLYSAHKSEHEQIQLKSLAERSYIYDRTGENPVVLTDNTDPQNRVAVPLAQIPKQVQDAVIAVEDADFYKHKGVNIRSIARAVDANLQSGDVAQGGSTITQQVVKNSEVGDEQSFSRKLREAFLAVELEKQMSKQEILEYYLNSVYFGGGAYGVQAAAEYYFDRPVSELGWAEGALLAALIASPNNYNPFRNPQRSLQQRKLALRRLVETGKLTKQEADFVALVPLPTTPTKIEPPRDYFLDEVKRQLLTDPRFNLGSTEEARARAVFQGGIKVHTTFDPTMQYQALAARNATVPGERGDGTFDITYVDDDGVEQETFGTQAITSIEPSTGAVRVMVGGPGWDRWKYNLVLQRPGRQPGSTMKTFVAATLFEEGYVPQNSLRGGSCTFDFGDGQEAEHFGGSLGSITTMTTSSSNCGYMALGQIAGVENVADLANRVGVKADLYLHNGDGDPTSPPFNLPLGTKEVTPLDMASAYATFANDGIYNEPYLIQRITDRNGKIIYEHQPQPRAVVDVRTARLVTEILQANTQYGTGRAAQVDSGQPVAGKTGTTNKSTDVWFVGYSPDLATAIWMGAPAGAISLDRNRELQGATGGKFPATTFGRYYSMIYEGRPVVEFAEAVEAGRGKVFPKVPYMTSSYSGTYTRRRYTPTTPTTGARTTPSTTAGTTPPDDEGGGGGGGGGGGSTPSTPPTSPGDEDDE